jgi:ribosomal protein L6P/L9E
MKRNLFILKKEKPLFMKILNKGDEIVISVKGPLGIITKTFSRFLFINAFVISKVMDSVIKKVGIKSEVQGLAKKVGEGLDLFFYHRREFVMIYQKLENMIRGVFYGHFFDMFLKGLGYRAWVLDNILYVNVGYTHIIKYEYPKDVIIKARKNRLFVFGVDVEKVTDVVNNLVKLRVADPYRGKGVRFVDGEFNIKPGKQR